MKYFFLVLSLFFLNFNLKAQVNENFEDGNFNENPVWLGDTLDFIISSSNQLKLNGTETNISYLSTENELINKTSWQFWLKHSFNSSANNYSRIYLSSNSENLKSDLQAYFLQIGGANDSVEFFKQNEQNTEKIFSFPYSYVGNSTNNLYLKIERDSLGNWDFYSKNNYEDGFIFEGNIFENTYQTTNFFGIYCKYTSSNSNKFYFDNLTINKIIKDTISPSIENFKILSKNSIKIIFSEKIDLKTAKDTNNYAIFPELENPEIIEIENDSSFILQFQNNLIHEQNYMLNIQNIKDLQNNEIENIVLKFSFLTAQKFDIVINEIMADPSPEIDLPDAEYIELYNNSDFDILMNNWTLSVGNLTKEIPTTTLKKNDFLLLCKTSEIENLSNFGKIIAVPSFPSLTNSGQNIVIKNQENKLIDSVSYKITWYQDENKNDGGYSLERIDPNNICGEMQNWKASTDEKGGTPCQINAVFENNIDIEKPKVLNIQTLDTNIIFIEFSENISKFNNESFNISDIGEANNFEFEDENFKKLSLFYEKNFSQNKSYFLKIKNLKDLCNNELDTNINFTYHSTLAFDILINEIMANPKPSVELPEIEYLELYNNSDFDINLSNWILEIGGSQKILENYVFHKNSYLLICKNDFVSTFQNFGKTIGLESFSLTNAGQDIVLKDNFNKIIHSVSYTENWYQDSYKSEGGFSLELIDFENPCGEQNNWTASEDEKGGTPCERNSVKRQNLDEQNPYALRIAFIDENKIEIIFNETLDSVKLLNKKTFFVENIGFSKKNIAVKPHYKSVILEFENSFEENKIYNLEIEQNICDCVGNFMSEKNIIPFAIPQKTNAENILMNEILFNPVENGDDFLEIYNHSKKVLDLKDILIGIKDIETKTLKNLLQITEKSFLFFPNEIKVLTKNTENIKTEYFCLNPDNFIEINDLFNFPNEEACIVLCDKNKNIIDEFLYHEDMHFDLLNYFDGISLERISFELATNNKNNWHTASENVGFATPTYENSQINISNKNEDEVSTEPEIFSPDNDGKDDYLKINYIFPKSNYIANITIFDAKGREVKKLVQKELLAKKGFFIWNGLNENNEKLSIGIYLIFVEIFDLKGKVKEFKKTTVLARKL